MPIAWLDRALAEVPYLTTLEVVEQSLGVSSPEPVYSPKKGSLHRGIWISEQQKTVSAYLGRASRPHSKHGTIPCWSWVTIMAIEVARRTLSDSCAEEPGLTGRGEVHLCGLSARGRGAGKAGIIQKQRRSGGLHS